MSVDVRVRRDGHRAGLKLRNGTETPIRTVSPVLYWAEFGALLPIPQLADGLLLIAFAPHQSATSPTEVAANEPGPPGSAAVRGAVAFTDPEGRRWLCLADAPSPVRVLDGHHRVLQSALGRS